MDELVVRTVVYAEPEEVYEFLMEFPRYARYSEYLRDVRRIEGDGGPGTRYALSFAWWKLSYTAHSEVVDVAPPERIDWRVTKDIDARGCWRVTPSAEPAAAAVDAETELAPDGSPTEPCEVAFEVRFDPESAGADMLDLPWLVSFDWVVRKVVPLIKREAERVVERAVADLEGRTRPVDLDVRADSERI